MATVNNTTATTAADIFAAINGNSSSSATAKSATADMGDRFLTLLMAQMKNQDPLNPLDNSQVTTQLAQINTVNGIEKLNATLTTLLSAYNDTQAMQSAGLIGKGVLFEGSTLTLSGGMAAGGATLGAAADKVVVKVLDSSGNLVQTENLGAKDAGTFSFVWDGKNAAGQAVKDGSYKFTVEATKADGSKVTAKALQLGTVDAVVRSTNGFVLDLGALGRVDFKNVQQII